MKKTNRRQPDLKRTFGCIEAGVWNNTMNKYCPDIRFNLRALYQDKDGKIKAAKTLSRNNMLFIQEALEWVDSLTIEDFGWAD